MEEAGQQAMMEAREMVKHYSGLTYPTAVPHRTPPVWLLRVRLTGRRLALNGGVVTREWDWCPCRGSRRNIKRSGERRDN